MFLVLTLNAVILTTMNGYCVNPVKYGTTVHVQMFLTMLLPWQYTIMFVITVSNNYEC